MPSLEASRLGRADPKSRKGDAAILAGLALLSLVLHLATAEAYGWFRDELYYVACGEHLDLGYVDHPPLAPWIARAVRELLGPSLVALRLLPFLAGSAVVFLAGWLAREMGGGRLAQVLAALCVLIAPVYLFLFHIFSMNAFEVLLWALAAWVLVGIVKSGEGRWWLLFGLIAGIGLENKHSMLLFGFAVFAATALTPQRRHFARPWIWLGGLIAFLLFLPNLLWQVRHGWPTLEFMDRAQRLKNVALSPGAFLAEQATLMHPLAVPLGLAGLAWLFFSQRGRRFRLFGWTYLVLLAVLLTQRSKPYYLAPIYPVLFAAGGTALEAWLDGLNARRLRPAAAGAIVFLLVSGGAATAPMTLPLLPVEDFLRYSKALGVQPSSGERHRLGELPQHYADMHGWEEMVAEVARVFRSLPAEERARAGIFAQNYGEAGAIDVLGRAYGLPKAMSGHNSYFLWGPGERGDQVLVILGGDEEDNRRVCPGLQQAGEVRCRYCMPYEDGLPVYVCRGLAVPIGALWPELKNYI